MFTHLWAWIVEHWIHLGFTLSEILALFPGKYNGIIQTVWKLLTGIVKK